MKTVNMHEAKTHLSKLVAAAEAGEPFIIARAGKPLVKVVPMEESPKQFRELGFGIGDFSFAPGDLDAYFDPALDKEIEDSFYAEDPLLTETMEAHAAATQQQKQK